MYYVYMYSHPDTMNPFYIGKGCGDRLYKHLNETYANTENKKKYAVIKNLLTNNKQPIITKIAEHLTEDDAYELEEFLIAELGRRDIDEGGILTNICDSRRPPSRKGARGNNWSPELRAYMSETRKGEGNPMYGKKHPNPQPPKFGKDNPFYGKKHTEEFKKKKSEQARKQFENPMNHGMYGKTHTEEVRAIMSEKAKNRKPNNTMKVHTPYGVFDSQAAFARKFNISKKVAWGMFNNTDVITARRIKNNPALKEEHIGKTYKEIGYYEL